MSHNLTESKSECQKVGPKKLSKIWLAWIAEENGIAFTRSIKVGMLKNDQNN